VGPAIKPLADSGSSEAGSIYSTTRVLHKYDTAANGQIGIYATKIWPIKAACDEALFVWPGQNPDIAWLARFSRPRRRVYTAHLQWYSTKIIGILPHMKIVLRSL
jgi:hypothetical protein